MNLKLLRSLLENKIILNLLEFYGLIIVYVDFFVVKDVDFGKIMFLKLKIFCCLFMVKKY